MQITITETPENKALQEGKFKASSGSRVVYGSSWVEALGYFIRVHGESLGIKVVWRKKRKKK